MTAILLLSSGLDSLCAWYYLNKPECIHISGHSRYSGAELNYVHRFQARNPNVSLRIIYDQDWMREFEEPDANINARNLFFVDIAAHYADKIYLVCQLGEQSIPDRSVRFKHSIGELLSFLYGKRKEVSFVFDGMTKQDMVSWYIYQGYPAEDLFSCYS